MAKQSRNTLKSYFETGKRPTEGQFSNLLDSTLLLDGNNTGSLKLDGTISICRCSCTELINCRY